MTKVRKFLGPHDFGLTRVIADKVAALSDGRQTFDLYLEMEVLQEEPKSGTFVPLSEHQSATPSSFYSGPPVLHYQSGRCKVIILERDLSLSPVLAALARKAQDTRTPVEPVTNGNGNYTQREEDEAEARRVLDGVEVWVTSESARSSYFVYGLVLTIIKQISPVLCRSLNRPLNTISIYLPSCNSDIT